MTMKKKYIYLIFLLAILMISISFMSNIFAEDIKKVALSNNYVNTFKKYLLREEYEISMPSEWEVKEKAVQEDKEFEIEFETKNIDGNLLILNGEIEKVLSEISNLYGKEAMMSFEINRWNYARRVEDNRREKYYFKSYSEGKILIVKYSYKESKLKDSIDIVFDEIINSIR